MNQRLIKEIAEIANERLEEVSLGLEEVKEKINNNFHGNLPDYLEFYYKLSRAEFLYKDIYKVLSEYDTLESQIPIERIVQMWCSNLMTDILKKPLNSSNQVKNLIDGYEREEDIIILAFLIDSFKDNVSINVNKSIIGYNEIGE